MARSFVHLAVCIFLLLVLAAFGGTCEAMQRSAAPMAPGSVVGQPSENWDTPASLQSGKAPMYPISLFVSGRIGYAEVAFTVGQDGSTHDIKVVEADEKAFGDHLAIVVRDWHFEPARKDGQPVESNMNFGMCFTISRNIMLPSPSRSKTRCSK